MKLVQQVRWMMMFLKIRAFEEYLLNEAEVFASELKDAEECGIDAQVLAELEADFEQAAETLGNHEGSTFKVE